jgi:hypothetical protein
MAKDSGRLAGGFDAENTGGVLSGLLAEEDEFDRRTLWRLGSWAFASVGAVIVAILANQSSIGIRREHTATSELARQQIQSIAKESQNETRRLAVAVETLNTDRDRLYSRLAALEQGLESVTGAVARQNSTSAPSQGAATAATVPPALAAVASTVAAVSSSPASPPSLAPPATAPAPETSTIAQKSTPAPAVAPLAASPTAAAEKAPAPLKAGDKPPATTARAEADPAALPSETPPASSMPAPPAPPVSPKSVGGPPDPAAAKLVEPAMYPPNVITAEPMPEVVATAPPAQEDSETESNSNFAALAVQRTEFGVDVGGANSIAGLRALWRGLLKSRSNAVLTTLRPMIVIREGSNGLGMQLRLVAGPISDAAAAAKICAAMVANERPCTTAVFEGQRLAMNPDEPVPSDANKPPSTGKPASQKRHVSKRTPPAEEPAPKPEPSTLTYILGRHQ